MRVEHRQSAIRAAVSLGALAGLIAVLVLWWPLRLRSWIAAIHVMAVIAWMAGMFYLPRLFVYHCGAEVGSKQSETFKVMEHRLLRQIINPAMVGAWATGVWLVWSGNLLEAGWLQAKLCFVLVLSGFHGSLAVYVRDFAADRNQHSQAFYRVFNEVPTLLMVAIVILVMVKPF